MLFEIAKWIVAFVALYCFGGLFADAIVPTTAKQHLWNPKWPPHAKFHNGQTMLMGILTGSLALFILFHFHPLTISLFLIAAAIASLYWISLLLAPLFPGTAWTDPEFRSETKQPLGFHPQQLLSYILCLLVLIAITLAILSM